MIEYDLRESPKNTLKIIPLGGVMEIGKNMTAYVYNDEIIVADAGLMFPEEEMLGVDIVIPDITFLEENSDKVKGIFITHGHEDHIGALPYVLRRLNVPVWGTALSIGFLSNKLNEHKLLDSVTLNQISAGDIIELGSFSVEYLRVSHSIPDAAGLIIRTPVGNIVHGGDFKFDQSPVGGYAVDFQRLARVGEEGVLVYLCDTTNAEKPGYTTSERLVGESFDRIFAAAPGRIIIAAFASNIHRVQQVYDTAYMYDKKVLVIGRSMEANCRIAEELGYLNVPDETRMFVSDIEKLDDDKIVIVTTGSQGEPLSALSKMAIDEHKHVKIQEDDTVIISATPIPGNESLVHRTVNRLFKQGANVIYESSANVHVSGHGNQEDIKMMINFLRPEYIIPVHGEQRHFSKFVGIAELMGYEKDKIFHMTPGDVLETNGEYTEIVGKVQAGMVMVDGLGVGDVEDVVLRDRRHLAQDGVVIVVMGFDIGPGEVLSGPDIFSRGFVGEDWKEELVEDAKTLILEKLNKFAEESSFEQLDDVRDVVRKSLAKFIYERTHRRPVIVPIVMEV